MFEARLSEYRDLTTSALLKAIPENGPAYLYELVASYPRRAGKGLRAALCFATCAAPPAAINSAPRADER